MPVTERTQSLADFREKASETLDRLNRTGEAEIITVEGEARAVLLSPAVWDEIGRELESSRDVATMRRALQEHAEGKARPAREFFDELRAKLLSMKAVEEKGTPG